MLGPAPVDLILDAFLQHFIRRSEGICRASYLFYHSEGMSMPMAVTCDVSGLHEAAFEKELTRKVDWFKLIWRVRATFNPMLRGTFMVVTIEHDLCNVVPRHLQSHDYSG